MIAYLLHRNELVVDKSEFKLSVALLWRPAFGEGRDNHRSHMSWSHFAKRIIELNAQPLSTFVSVFDD